jgi:DNA-binding response OmpR family regulator
MSEMNAGAGNCRKLLVLEGDATIRYLLTKVFHKRRWDVHAVSSSEHALEAYDTERPDLILLEPAIDKRTKWSFLSLLASAPLATTPPVILATFLAFENPIIPPAIERCINLIATFIKPFELNDLLNLSERVRAALPGQQFHDA